MVAPNWSWTFRGFETPGRNRPVQDWYDKELSQDERDEIDDLIQTMRVVSNIAWRGQGFKPLNDGLSEIRMDTADFWYRIYGYFGPAGFRQSYVLLHGTNKKVKNDKDGKKLAKKRMDQIKGREAGHHVFEFDYESAEEAAQE